MTKRTTVFIVLLLLLLAGPAFIKYQQIQAGMKQMANNATPPSSVEVIGVSRTNWEARVGAVGTLTARDGIEVRNEVEGVIEIIHVDSGQWVEEGDLLVSLNDDVEQADMVSLKAQEELALANFKRVESMWKKKTISETEFDNARSNLKVAQANLVQIQARLAKKSIRAPFSGVVGIRNVSKGQYVAPGSSLFSLQDHAVLYTDFSVPESYFPLISPGLEVQFKVSANPDRIFTGAVQAVDAKVDEATRNINVRAVLHNEDGLLLPGMYADIYLILDRVKQRLVVPSTAIVFSSFGDAVFIIEQNEQGQPVANRVQVVTGEQRGDQVEILEGLKGNEDVVQAGTSKLRNNTPVVVNEQRRLKG
ncbi:MAG: efflux RND transporter periplasmic adaptor subunit [Gammaproteobacteria bacterium]|nr:efflux RND transporter periplasmic adaptor subunit [Gammaproteobacteria bacterium]